MMHRALSLAAAVLAATLAPGAASAANVKPVVELFTSQSCSSCPPADALLVELARREEVIALSYHVDYWNYIGWADPFSSKESTMRQRGYREELKLRYVYTPQIVVDGVGDAVGSSKAKVSALIEMARKREKVRVTLATEPDGAGRVQIASGMHRGAPATVWAVIYDKSHTTAIARGENAGVTITNANVVRVIKKIGEWRGEAVEIRLAADDPDAQGHDYCAILVQAGDTGPIIGAGSWPLPGAQARR